MEPGVFLYTGGNLEVPLDVEHLRVHASCRKIEDKVCIGRKNLKTVLCEEGLVEIGESAFEDCPNLESFEIPSTLQKIGHRALAKCKALRSPKLNEGLKSIGIKAFFGCPRFNYLYLPTTLRRLYHGAYGECSNLKEIVLGSGLVAQKTIKRDTFEGCDLITLIVKPDKLAFVDGAVSDVAEFSIETLNEENSQKVLQKLEEEIAEMQTNPQLSIQEEIAMLKEKLQKAAEERAALEEEKKRIAEEGEAAVAKMQEATGECEALKRVVEESDAKLKLFKSDLDGKLQMAIKEKESSEEANLKLQKEREERIRAQAVLEAKLASTEGRCAEKETKLQEKEAKELKNAEELGTLKERIKRLCADQRNKHDSVVSEEPYVRDEELVGVAIGIEVPQGGTKVLEVSPIKAEVESSSTETGGGMEPGNDRKRKTPSNCESSHLSDPATEVVQVLTEAEDETGGQNARRFSRRLKGHNSQIV